MVTGCAATLLHPHMIYAYNSTGYYGVYHPNPGYPSVYHPNPGYPKPYAARVSRGGPGKHRLV